MQHMPSAHAVHGQKSQNQIHVHPQNSRVHAVTRYVHIKGAVDATGGRLAWTATSNSKTLGLLRFSKQLDDKQHQTCQADALLCTAQALKDD